MDEYYKIEKRFYRHYNNVITRYVVYFYKYDDSRKLCGEFDSYERAYDYIKDKAEDEDD